MKLRHVTLSETKKSYADAVLWSKREVKKIEKKEKIQKELIAMVNAIRKEQKVKKIK